MAPNSSVKTATVVRVVLEAEQKEYNDRIKIRTDFVLQNIYSYILKNVHNFEAVRPANSEEEKLLYELKQIVDDFKYSNEEKIRVLCGQLNVTIDNIGSSLYGVSNELFVEGISWSTIIALFVFVAILTIHCLERNMSEDVVDIMYECFCRLVKENLKPWIDDHGGWNGILCMKKRRPVGWTKHLMSNAFSVIGTLANIANIPC